MPDFGGRTIPRLYPILDAEMVLRGGAGDRRTREALLRRIVAELADAGVEILQYRNKRDDDETVAEDSSVIRDAAASMKLILNDRAALAAALGWDGVHIGQDDMPASEARHRLGPAAWVGLSTHNEEQTQAAGLEPVDYIATGPVFATSSKANPDPVIGLEGVRRARGLTSKPLVAIGGITADTATAVIDAGADAVAVIGAVFASGLSVSHSVRDFLAKFK